MAPDRRLYLAGALFHALVSINSEGLLAITVAIFAAFFLYLGLPGLMPDRAESEGSNKTVNGEEQTVDKEKQSDQ